MHVTAYILRRWHTPSKWDCRALDQIIDTCLSHAIITCPTPLTRNVVAFCIEGCPRQPFALKAAQDRLNQLILNTYIMLLFYARIENLQV